MRKILLVAFFAASVQAATNRVCWQPEPGAVAKCTAAMNQIGANAFLAQANRDYPEIRHWIITEPDQVNWQRLRWIGAGIAVAATYYDVHTTQEVLAAGGVENNFLYGAHPSAARMYGFSLGLIAGQSLVIQWWRHRHPENARTADQVGFISNLGAAAMHGVAGLHNESVLKQQRAIDSAAQ